MNTQQATEYEKWVRVYSNPDWIRVIVEDDTTCTRIFKWDRKEHTSAKAFWIHLCRVLNKQVSSQYWLLLHPWHLIENIDAIQMNDVLKLTTVSNYNTLLSERKRTMMEQYQKEAEKSTNGVLDASKTKMGDDSGFSSFPPLIHSGKVPQLKSSNWNMKSNQMIRQNLGKKIPLRAPWVQTNFDLTMVDIRGIMNSEKLKTDVRLAAKNNGLKIKWTTEDSGNGLVFNWENNRCTFKLAYRKYEDGTFLLHAAVLAHTHAEEAEPPKKSIDRKSKLNGNIVALSKGGLKDYSDFVNISDEDEPTADMTSETKPSPGKNFPTAESKSGNSSDEQLVITKMQKEPPAISKPIPQLTSNNSKSENPKTPDEIFPDPSIDDNENDLSLEDLGDIEIAMDEDEHNQLENEPKASIPPKTVKYDTNPYA